MRRCRLRATLRQSRLGTSRILSASNKRRGRKQVMNEHDLKHIIEATLLAAGRPVPTQELLELFDERERPSPEQFQAAVELLHADYANRGIELLEVSSGWRIQVRQRTAEVVSRLWQER